MGKKELLWQLQKRVALEHVFYKKCIHTLKDKKNKEILLALLKQKKRQYAELYLLSKRKVTISKAKVMRYLFYKKIFGLSFVLRLLQRRSHLTHRIMLYLPRKEAQRWIAEEKTTRKKLKQLKDERVTYAGAIILGLNDALVELTGALAGLSFALRDTKLIAVTGLITGFAAALSMGIAEFLSAREEQELTKQKKPLTGAYYTGVAYMLTVLLLIAPYLFFSNAYGALACTLAISIIIVSFYSFYITTIKDLKFLPRFMQMAGLSLGVAALTFIVGIILKSVMGVEV